MTVFRNTKFIVLFFAIVFIAGFALNFSSTLTSSAGLLSKVSSIVSAQSASAEKAPVITTGKQPAEIVADLNKAIASDTDVESAVSLVDLDSGTQYDAGETGVVFKAASTAKLIAVIDYLHEVELGNATLSQSIEGSSAQQLIKRMLLVSDNDAWAAINDYLGNKQQAYATSIGLTSFTGGDYNTITAADEAKLLTMLYQGKLINAQHTSLMYGYMNAADGTDLIKAALPSDATVYHKYGLLWGNLDDTAIIKYKGHNFALVIYTKKPDNTTDDYTARLTLIHQITQVAVADMTSAS